MTKINLSQSIDVDKHETPEPSYIENILAAAFDAIGLPYERQYELNGKFTDFAFPEAQLIVECDGYAYHHTKEDRDRDTDRDNTFALLGWHTMRFTGSRINKDPLGCALKVKHVYQQRAAMLSLTVSKALCGEYAFSPIYQNLLDLPLSH